MTQTREQHATIRALLRILVIATALLGISVLTAQAQHTDSAVSLGQDDETGETILVVAPQVSVSAFDEVFGELFTFFPGFRATDGTLNPGDTLSLHFDEPLLYYGGQGVTATPNGEKVTVDKGPVFTTLTSEETNPAAFLFAKAGTFGGVHEDLNWTLISGTGPPAGGLYGIAMHLATSAEHLDSERFLYLFANLTSEFSSLEQIDAGRQVMTAYVFPIVGDVNRDGVVGLPDFNLLKQNFGRQNAVWEEGDLDGDSAVGLADFNLLKSGFGATHSVFANNVPEPSARCLAIFAFALYFPIAVRQLRRY